MSPRGDEREHGAAAAAVGIRDLPRRCGDGGGAGTEPVAHIAAEAHVEQVAAAERFEVVRDVAAVEAERLADFRRVPRSFGMALEKQNDFELLDGLHVAPEKTADVGGKIVSGRAASIHV